MFNKKVQDEMNKQIQRELESAYIYLSMAAYFEDTNLPGFANWMRMQFKEEQIHAFKFFDYVNDRNGRVMLEAINQPQVEFESPVNAFEITLGHEEKITGHINDLYALATRENDYASQTLLQWFITEQIEEEKNAGDILTTLRMMGGDYSALLILDRELAQRIAPPEVDATVVE
ncbi:MAG: ferritin [Anaerolineaceae bacterium]|nr:ferritin [Anaerolineaceae bacterium]